MATTPIRIDISEIFDFEDDLSASEKRLQRADHIQDTADAVAAAARGRAPSLTGALAGTIYAGGSGAKSFVSAGESLEYAAVQEFGWPGHNIVASSYIWDSIAEEDPESKWTEAVEDSMRPAFPFL